MTLVRIVYGHQLNKYRKNPCLLLTLLKSHSFRSAGAHGRTDGTVHFKGGSDGYAEESLGVMNVSSSPVVSSREEYELVFSDLRRVVNLSARLPDSPFLSDEGTDSFCEFEHFRSGLFGPHLEALALQFHDEYVSGATLQSEFYVDFEDRNGTFAALHIPTSQVAGQYWQALRYEPDDKIADAMYFSAHVLSVAGSSGSWAIWGEQDTGVAIVRTVGSDVSWRDNSEWFLSPEEAIEAFIEPSFNRHPLPAEWRKTFLRNARPFGGYEE
jgi:hypothetical protein